MSASDLGSLGIAFARSLPSLLTKQSKVEMETRLALVSQDLERGLVFLAESKAPARWEMCGVGAVYGWWMNEGGGKEGGLGGGRWQVAGC